LPEKTWDKDAARKILYETVNVIDESSSAARSLLVQYRVSADQVREDIEALGAVAESLTAQEISTNRSSPWITRSQASTIISTLRAIRSLLDMSSLVKISMDLTNQAKAFIEVVAKVERSWGQNAQEEGDIEKYLTIEQLMQLAIWIDEGKMRREEVYDSD